MAVERAYKYKLDFYYISLIVYFLFLAVYVVLRGSFSDETFRVVFQDPIIYIVSAFIILFFVLLISNWIRGRELIFTESSFAIKNRWGSREIPFADVLNVKFSRERRRKNPHTSPVRIVKLKLRNRKRNLRIRISEFNNVKQLVNEFRTIAKSITQNASGRN